MNDAEEKHSHDIEARYCKQRPDPYDSMGIVIHARCVHAQFHGKEAKNETEAQTTRVPHEYFVSFLCTSKKVIIEIGNKHAY